MPSYRPQDLTQDQRQQLWSAAGHAGIAPVGYGGEGDGPSNNSNGSSGGNGFTPLSAPDLAKLRDQVYETLKPYYTQLAKEAQGDYGRAVSILQEDYTKGVRDQRMQFAFTQKKQEDDLRNTLSSLGITNLQDQNTAIDSLNKRGMAVYQNNDDGTPNALKTSTPTANTAYGVAPGQAYDDTSTVSNPSDPTMGRGGYELAQLQLQQKLRQEAEQRAATKPIEQAGIQLKQYTNLPDGIDPNMPADQLAKALSSSGVDRSSLGSAEQGLVRGQEQKTRELQQTQEDLANQRSNDVSQIAGEFASTGTKALGSDEQNQILKEKQDNFATTGTT